MLFTSNAPYKQFLSHEEETASEGIAGGEAESIAKNKNKNKT